MEYRTDDARLTIEVMKQAIQHGALAVNYMKATSFQKENGTITGIHVVDQLNGNIYTVMAKK